MAESALANPNYNQRLLGYVKLILEPKDLGADVLWEGKSLQYLPSVVLLIVRPAAQMLEEILSKEEFINELQKLLTIPAGGLNAPMKGRIDCLFDIPFSALLTTNLDPILEGHVLSSEDLPFDRLEACLLTLTGSCAVTQPSTRIGSHTASVRQWSKFTATWPLAGTLSSLDKTTERCCTEILRYKTANSLTHSTATLSGPFWLPRLSSTLGFPSQMCTSTKFALIS